MGVIRRVGALAALCITATALVVVAPAAAAPLNDSFSNATTISGTSGTWTGTTDGATRENNEPVDPSGGGRTVWFRWTPSTSGPVSLDLRGSAFDTILSVYTGSRVRSLAFVARNDNAAEWNDDGSSRLTFNATAYVTYQIQIDGRYGATGSYRLTLNRQPPPNDAFAAAQGISGATGSVTGSLLLATRETAEPVHRGVSAGNSVWYRWTAPTTGVFRFDTHQSQNTIVAAYTGSSLSALLSTGDCTSYDYGCTEILATAGQSYSIAVDGTSSPHFGTMTLHWEQVPAPPNDAFANAQGVPDTGGTLSGTTVGATREAGEPFSPQRTVWFRFAPRWSGEWILDTSTTIQSVQLFAGNSLTTLSLFDGEMSAGTTYWIRVDGGSSPGTFSIMLSKAPPANDDFGGADYLRNSWTQSTAGATKEPGEANHAGNAGGASVWFFGVNSAPGTLTIDTIGSDFNTLLAVYSGGIELASDDDSGGNGTSRLSLHMSGSGGFFSVAVDGFDGAFGTLVLHESFQSDPPANDGFASAAWLSGVFDHTTGRTNGATKEAGEPNHAGNAGGRSVWYRWTAPTDGLAHFDTFGDGEYPIPFDTLLAVYTGSSVDALSLVAAEDPRYYGSYSGFPVTAGTVYRIAVDGKDGAAGSFTLDWKVSPPNDDYATAQTIDGPSGSLTATTALATFEPLDLDWGYRYENGNVWYRWRAPVTGDVAWWADDAHGRGLVQVVTGATLGTALGVDDVTWDEQTGITRFHARTGVVYHLSVVAAAAFTLHWQPTVIPPQAVRPANDDFNAAQTITGASGSLTEDVTAATIEDLEPYHDPIDEEPGYGSVWFRWTAPFTGQVTFDTTGSDYEPVVAVYGGMTIDTIVPIAANTNQLTQRDTFVRVGVTAGDTLLIAVGRGICCPATRLQLAWRDTTSSAPANDNLSAAQALAGTSGTLSASNIGASKELFEPDHAGAFGGASLWYRWTAPASGPVGFMTEGTADTVLAAYRADASGAFELVRENWNSSASAYASRIAFTAEAGATYWLAVDTSDAHWYHLALNGSFTLAWRQPPTPPNDAFVNATAINPSGYYVSTATRADGDNFGATREPGEPNHGGNAGGASVWWRLHYDSSWSQDYVVTTVGSDFDTLLGVYVGATVSSLTVVGSDDDSGGDGAARIQFTAQPGVRDYWIAVDGKNGANGHVVLGIVRPGTPRNDSFRAAVPISGATGSVTGSVFQSTREVGELLPDDDWPRDGTVWYRWTAPATSTWHFHTTVGVLGVWQGTLLRSLVEVGDSRSTNDVDAAVTAGTAYYVQLASDWDYDGSGADFTLSWRQSVAPANDRFAAALPLSGATGTVTQSNDEASVEPAEPFHAGAEGGVSLWYSFTAPADGTLALDTFGSSFDTVLAAYTGGTLLDLNEAASNDDFAGSFGSDIRFAVTAGTTYRIAVDDALLYGCDIPANTVALRWTFAPPPANDPFASAQALSGGSGSVSGTTLGARSEPGEAPHADRASGASVWYSWTAPATANVTFSLGGDGFVGVYRGDSVSALSVVRRSDDAGAGTGSLAVAVAAGATYRVAVDGLAGAAGPFTLSWAPGAPPNDAFAAAQGIAGRSGTVLAATVGASKEAGEPNHAGDPGGASVWYRWTAPQSEVVGFDTLGSSYDTLLAVYSGSALSALTPVAASNDAPGLRTSSVRVPVTDGTTYWIVVDGAVGATGNAALHWYPSPAPPNDDRAAAELIGGRQGWTYGSTFGSLDGTVWYAWRAPAEGPVTFELQQAWAPQTLAVYRGSTLLTQGPGPLTVAATSDETLAVAVSGTAGYQLKWTQPPPNDLFANAQSIAGETGSVAGTLEGAGIEANEPGSSYDQSVWYRWTAPTTGTYAFDTGGSASPTNVLVGIGGAPNAIAYAGARLGVTAGTTYVVRVWQSFAVPHGPIVLNWRRDATVLPNDLLGAARTVSGASGTLTESLVGAALEPGEPWTTYRGSQTLWYRWTAPASGRLMVETRGTDGDSALGIFAGTSLTSLTRLADSGGWAGGTYFYGLAFVDVTAGTSLLFQLSSDYGRSAQLTWGLDTQTGPAAGSNDMFANAFSLTGANGSASGSNIGATKEAGEPNHAGNAGGHSVWWTWTAPASGPTGITTESSSIDTLLGIYTGSSVGALALVGANDDDGSTGGRSTVSFSAVQGTTYRIAVDGKNGVTGAIGLRWTGQPADTTAPSTTIVSGPSGTTSSTTATFSFTTSELGIRFECALDAGAWAGCTSPASFSGVALGTHTFKVRGIDASGNAEALPPARTWTIAAQPGNDAFGSATVLNGLTGFLVDANTGATTETGEPRHASEAVGSSVWYRWTPTRDGIAQFGVDAAEFRYPTAAVYTGSAVGSLTPVARLADDTFVVQAGTTYSIAVDGAASGIFRLIWRNAPTNDDVSRPAVVSGTSGTWRGDNLGATKAAGEPAHGGDPGGASVWLTWSAPATGSLSLDTLGGDPMLDTLLAVYTYGYYDSPTLVAEDNDSAGARKSALRIQVFEGTQYLIALDGFGGTAGQLALNWTLAGGSASSPPSVQLTAPADGARVSGVAVTLSATASDADGIDRVEFLVGGGVVGFDREAPYELTWDSTTVLDGAQTISARAIDTTGAMTSAVAHGVSVDNTPPYATIDSGPDPYAPVTATDATFTFHSEPNATFECRLDGAAFAACSSPRSYSGLSTGMHRFEVRAIDEFGTTGPSQPWTWEIAPAQPSDTTPPDTVIQSGPSGTTTDTTATFQFAATEASTFQCRLDGGAWTPCASPQSYAGLAIAAHTFDVRATDTAGNVDPTPASRTWTVSAPADTTPPETTIDSGPSGTVTSTSASFTFSSSEAGSAFECRLDGAAWSACTSPRSYSALAAATHTFEVRARDGAGNLDATPASRTWTVQAAPASNDLFSNATSISGSGGSTSGTTVGMTKEAGEPNHAGNTGGHSIWYAWTAPATGSVTIDTIGSSFDTLLGAYTGTSVSALTLVAANDDASGLQSRVIFTASGGTTYRIAVDGYGGASGSVTLHWAQGATSSGPANDMFAAAQAVTGTATGTTVGATKETGEPNHAGNPGGHSIWFTWTAPAAGQATVSLAGSSFDTLLGVYTGSTVSTLALVAGNDDANGTLQSQVVFTAAAGATYRIAVDGYGGAAGSVSVRASQP